MNYNTSHYDYQETLNYKEILNELKNVVFLVFLVTVENVKSYVYGVYNQGNQLTKKIQFSFANFSRKK